MRKSRPFASGKVGIGSIILLVIVLAGVGWFAYRIFSPEGGGKEETKKIDPVATTRGGESVVARGQENFRKDLEALTGHPHRQAGSKGALAAAAYVEKRLLEIGIEEVLAQDFPVVTGRYSDVSIQVDGEAEPRPLYACRPNLLIGSITPAEGLTAETIYVRGGTLAEYGTQDPKGKIVLMDFDSGARRWQWAFAMAAKAVVFVGHEGRPAAVTWHHVSVPALLPRFYLPAADAAAMGLLTGPNVVGPRVTLKSRIEWGERVGRNVIAVIRGRSPQYSKERGPEAILLAVPIDSFGEVPDLAKGGRHAANVAAMLGIAEFLKNTPTSRDIILCFFDGRGSSHAGARAFYGAVLRERKRNGLTLDERAKRFDAEKEFTEEAATALAAIKDDFDDIDDDQRSKVLVVLRRMAKILATDNREASQTLRDRKVLAEDQLDDIADEVDRIDHRRRDEEVEAGALAAMGARREKLLAMAEGLRADVKAIVPQLEARMAESPRWGSVQRAINDKDLTDEVMEYFEKVRTAAQEALEGRMAELTASIKYNEAAVAVKKLLERREPDAKEGAKGKMPFIELHLTVDLSGSSRNWTLVHGDQSRPDEWTDDKVGSYTDIFKAIVSAIELGAEHNAEVEDFDVRAIDGKSVSDPLIFSPCLRADSSAIARLFGVWNLSAITTFDRRGRDGQPFDTVEAITDQPNRMENFRLQSEQVGRLVWAMGHANGLSLGNTVTPVATFSKPEWTDGKVKGPTAMLFSSAAAVADRPARGGIVAVMPGVNATNWGRANVQRDVPGYGRFLMTSVDGNGSLDFGPVAPAWFNYVCALFDERGMPTYISNGATVHGNIAHAVQVFKAKTLSIVGLGYSRRVGNTQVLQAKSTAAFRATDSLIAEEGQIIAVYVRPLAQGLKLFHPMGMSVLNNSIEHEAGVGVALKTPFDFISTLDHSAANRLTLNEARLQLLTDNHIVEPSLQRLHNMAREALNDADRAKAIRDERAALAAENANGAGPATRPATTRPAATRPAAAEDLSLAKQIGDRMASDAISRKAYGPTLAVLNDLVVAVVLLLVLAIPFAYALERLIIGTPHIYRQIGYVTVLFLATFVVLYFVNPAFRIATTPVIIFLAFAIIVLSALVIFIMMRKLTQEVHRMQGLGTTVHSSDVSRISTMMAAANMGISTMRRRPLRTLLTAITVVLLTFTILTFASFANTWGIRATYVGSLDGPPRVMVRRALYGQINEDDVEIFRGRMRGRATVAARWWVAPTAGDARAIKSGVRGTSNRAVASPANRQFVELSGLVGLERADLTKLEALSALFSNVIGPTVVDSFTDDAVFLTPAVAEELGLTPGDELLLDGLPVTLAGLVSDNGLSGYMQMEGSSVLPVDYQGSGFDENITEEREVAATQLPEMETTQFVNYAPDRIGFVTAATAERLGGRIRSFMLHPEDPTETQAIAAEAARHFEMPAYIGDEDGVHRLYFTILTEASGFKDLLIPVVLGGLIVFATMLGSVSDREREIYTFSALGLAPAHVAGLFFAEACIYAVVGGMGGYLLGQTVGRVLGMLAEMGWLEVPSMNYSSTNAIVTVLIVMATVLVSTIFPAVKASRSANPGVQRMWRIPKPDADLYDLVFPFTVSSYDITGVVSFLKEHFDNYTDTNLGVFAAERSAVFRQRGSDLLGFEAALALAPFDLGITQDYALVSRPSEIEGVDEVRILIRRRSGTPGDWRRSNRVFIADLRRQLLIWRSLPSELVERYRKTTLDNWESLPVGSELVDAVGEAQ